MRSRVTAFSGRSPGLRVDALDHLPRTFRFQWFIGRKLADAAEAVGISKARHLKGKLVFKVR